MPGLEIVIVVLSGLSLTLLQLRERPVLSLAAALVLVGAPALGGISPSRGRVSSSIRSCRS
jgi:hypothetical protein